MPAALTVRGRQKVSERRGSKQAPRSTEGLRGPCARVVSLTGGTEERQGSLAQLVELCRSRRRVDARIGGNVATLTEFSCVLRLSLFKSHCSNRREGRFAAPSSSFSASGRSRASSFRGSREETFLFRDEPGAGCRSSAIRGPERRSERFGAGRRACALGAIGKLRVHLWKRLPLYCGAPGAYSH